MSAVAKKVCMVSLGCPKNLVDAEMMLGFLRNDGFELSANPQESEVIVVNTCGFIEASKTESIDKIFEMARLKQEGRCEILVATGCLTQRYSQELAKEMPEVDLFVGLGEFNRLGALLQEKLLPLSRQTTSQKTFVERRAILPDPDLPRILATPSHYSYLKISEGCSHRCSFCIIPHIRGDLKSRSIDSIVGEVKNLLQRGVKEFNLIAQDLNEYGKDLRNQTTLQKLIQALDEIPGEFWLRPHYMYPLEFTDSLIQTLRDAQHVVKYIDMPLQHINERILRSMKRGSPSRYVRQVLTKLYQNIPDLALRTTFIVGYPGETEAEFQELYNFIEEYRFDHVGVFQYSPEEGTTAAEMPDPVAAEVKEERFHRLMELQQQISHSKNQALLGRTFRLLAEGPSEESDWVSQARLARQAPDIDGVVYLSGEGAEQGEFFDAKIIEAHDYDLVAERCDLL